MQADSAARVAHVVDDEAVVRRSLMLLLRAAGFEARAYDSGTAFLRAAEAGGLPFGCLLLDIRMPVMDGMAVMQEMAQRGLRFPVVVVTGHGDVPLAVAAMKAGACDFIEKPYSGAAILKAVEAAFGRGDEEQARTREAADAAARIAMLTRRETEVLLGLVAGRQNKVIAHDLGLSPRTVEIHRANAMTRLGAGSLSEAVRIALAGGLRPPEQGVAV
jgi:two-component system response regulator FixJ